MAKSVKLGSEYPMMSKFQTKQNVLFALNLKRRNPSSDKGFVFQRNSCDRVEKTFWFANIKTTKLRRNKMINKTGLHNDIDYVLLDQAR